MEKKRVFIGLIRDHRTRVGRIVARFKRHGCKSKN